MKREVTDGPVLASGWRMTVWFYFTMTALVIFLLGYSMGSGDADIDERLDRLETGRCLE